jgi:hypothetical protein
MTATTSFLINSLVSFRVQSLQAHDMQVIARAGATAGELTRHIGVHFNVCPLDLFLTVKGAPLQASDEVLNDDRQHILLRTRLRGGVRRSSRAPANLDVTKELRTIRKVEPLEAQQDEGQQTRIRAGLQKLRDRMWAKNHHLLPEMDQLLLETTETSISQGDLQKLHHLSTECNGRLSQQGLFCQSSCSYTGMGDPCPNQIPEWMRTGENGPTEAATGLLQDPDARYLKATREIPEEAFSCCVRRNVNHPGLGPRGQSAQNPLCKNPKISIA